MVRIHTSWRLGASLLLAAVLPSGVLAAHFDGSSNMICAALEVVACTDDSVCLHGQARQFDLSEFMLIDVKKKQVRLTDEHGRDELTPIQNMEITEEQVVLQGVENHKGWSATIDRETGRISIALAGSEVSYMIFGACTIS